MLFNESLSVNPKPRRRSRNWYDIRGGQRTDKTADKIPSETFSDLLNVRIDRGDLIVRPGTRTLTNIPENINGAGLYRSGIETCLMGSVESGEIPSLGTPPTPVASLVPDPGNNIPAFNNQIQVRARYKVTFVSVLGETLASEQTDQVVWNIGNFTNPITGVTDPTFTGQITLPIGPEGTIARNIYADNVNGGVFRRFATINDNTTTDFADNRTFQDFVGVEPSPTVLSEAEADVSFPREPIMDSSGGVLSDIVKIDSQTGIASVIFEGAGQSLLDDTSLHGYFYGVTGNDRLYYYSVQDDSGMVESGEFTISNRLVKVESLNDRVLVVERTARQDIVRVSRLTNGIGLINGDFIPSGDGLGRAITLRTKINRIRTVKSSGNFIFLFGDEDAEVHLIPSPNDSGRTTLPLEYDTLVRRFENVGDVGEEGAVVIGQRCYFMTQSTALQFISPDTREPNYIYDNRGQIELLLWDQAALGYNSVRKELYITGKERSVNNLTMVYDLETGQFSYDRGYYVQKWIHSDREMFFLDCVDRSIKKAFDKSFVQDDDQDISYSVTTKQEELGDDHYFKWAEMVDLEFLAEFPTKVFVDFFADRQHGDITSEPDRSLEVDIFPERLIVGASGFDTDPDLPVLGNVIEQNLKLAVNYKRGEMRLSGRTRSGFTIKKIGWSSRSTSKLFKRS